MSASIAVVPLQPALARSRRVSVRDLLILVPAAILVGYVLSPYLAVARLALAIRSHDVGTMTTAVDWVAVRAGLGSEFGAVAPVQSVSATADDLPDFGSSFASNATASALQDDVTPARMADMLATAPARLEGGTIAAVRALLGGGGFAGLRRFDLAVDTGAGATPLRVRFHFDPLHGWRVEEVQVPREMLAANSRT